MLRHNPVSWSVLRCTLLAVWGIVFFLLQLRTRLAVSYSVRSEESYKSRISAHGIPPDLSRRDTAFCPPTWNVVSLLLHSSCD